MVSAPQSLTRSTAGGVAWSWAGTLATAVLQIVYTAVMSRLLEPSDFGLVAAALVGLRFVTYVSRFGLGSAVVQRETLTRDEAAIALRLALGVGLGTGAVAVLLSPALASLVGQPGAAEVMRWLAVALVFGSLTTVPEALVRRRLEFRGLALAQVASFGVGYLGVGISMARAGAGVWSLVGATITQSAVLLVITWMLARPPLTTAFSRRSARELLSFGGTVTILGFIEFLSGSIDTIAVGRWIGPSALGQYSRATYLVGLPVEQATTAVSRVLMPGLSQVQGDPRRFANAVTRGSGLMACVVIIPMAAVAAAATAIVPLLLGPGWESAAGVVPIVGAAYGLSLLTHLPAVAAEALGVVRMKLVIQSATLALTMAAVGGAAATGATLHRLALAWASGEVVRHILYWVVAFPRLGIRRRDIAARYAAAGCLAIAISAPLIVATRVLGRTGIASLIVAGLVGIVAMGMLALTPLTSILKKDVRAVRASMVSPSTVATSVER